MPRLISTDTPTPSKRSQDHESPVAPTHRIVPEDYFTLASIDGVSLSPSGDFVAYRESRWVDGDRHYHLWVVDTATREARRVTHEPAAIFAPQWSPDESTIYYAAPGSGQDDPGIQIWRVEKNGSEPKELTQVPGGISRFAVPC